MYHHIFHITSDEFPINDGIYGRLITRRIDKNIGRDYLELKHTQNSQNQPNSLD